MVYPCIVAEKDLDNVKAQGFVRRVLFKKNAGCIQDMPLLCFVDRLAGKPVTSKVRFVVLSGLDLDKDETVARRGDKVDFAVRRAEVAANNFITLSPKIPCGNPLAAVADIFRRQRPKHCRRPRP